MECIWKWNWRITWNALEETSVIQLELEKEFGGTGLHLEVELESVSITMVTTVRNMKYAFNIKRGVHVYSSCLIVSAINV